MKVRAKSDGLYDGHYRHGPYTDDYGFHEGAVFEIDATPYPKKDEHGNPIQKMEPTGEVNPLTSQLIMKKVWVMHEGKIKKDHHGQPIPVYEMATLFSNKWMEVVNEDATISYPEQSEPMGVLPNYREKPKTPEGVVAARPGEIPADIKSLLAEREKSPL